MVISDPSRPILIHSAQANTRYYYCYYNVYQNKNTNTIKYILMVAKNCL